MRNLDAFLTMVAISEGTELIGNHGYNCIVGSTISHPMLFDSYKDHPRIKVHLRPDLTSTAAGRYQILERYFDAYKKQLNLPDFSPTSQDHIAMQMIAECDAMVEVMAGDVRKAITKCASRWASLPGAGYGQHENTVASLQQAFTSAGGQLA